MTMRFSQLFSIALGFFVALSLCVPTPAYAQESKSNFVEKMADGDLLNALRKGGYVLYMRHGTTDNNRADQTRITNFDDCETQRILNDEGRRLAIRIGTLIRKAEIPISEVFYGPMCRTRETAELAFPNAAALRHQALFLASSSNLTSSEKVQMLQEMKRLILKPVSEHSNRMLISHAPNLADFMGYFVRPEGTIVVLKARGEEFEYIASIPPKLLEQLVK